MRAATPNSEWMAIHPEDKDKPESEQTRFFFRELDVCEDAYLDDQLGSMRDDGFNVRLGTRDLIVLDIGLSRVENLLDEKDSPVEPKRDPTKKYVETGSDRRLKPWDRKSLRCFSKDVRTWMAKTILEGKVLKEAEVKNS